jgi:hypothetical protein
MLKEI